MRSVTLIGMPGSGKSAVGRIIADRLGLRFVDTDKLIEQRQGKPLQQLINEVGDDLFLEMEEACILDLAPEEPAVISPGGSVVYSDRAMRHLRGISTVVFLDAELEELRAHIASEAPRGIIRMPEGGLEELYRERLPRYRHFAELTVALRGEDVRQAAEKVLSALRLDRE